MLSNISIAFGESPTMNAVLSDNSAFYHFLEDTFENEERKKFLLQTDEINLTIFHCATACNNTHLFKSIFSEYRKRPVNDSEMKKLIVVEDSQDEHILFHCLDCSWIMQTIQELWTLLSTTEWKIKFPVILLSIKVIFFLISKQDL